MSELENSKFGKQFILSTKQLDVNVNWNSYSLYGYNLYSHPKLPVTVKENESFKLFFLGNAYSYTKPKYNNQDILDLACQECVNFDAVLKWFDDYCGVFVVIFIEKITGEVRVFNDAAAIKEVFYIKCKGETIVASDAKIIQAYFDLVLDESPEALEFFNSKAFELKKCYVGNKTQFLDLLRLKPNHYLNLDTIETKRFFPYEPLVGTGLMDSAKVSAEMLSGYLESASNRYKLHLPVSAGWESRVLLAASKSFKDKLKYFVFKWRSFDESHEDIQIPKKLSEKLNLNLEIVDDTFKLSNEQLKVVESSVSIVKWLDRFAITMSYWLAKYPNDAWVLGNVSEIAREEFDDIKLLDEYKISIYQKYACIPYAVNTYRDWLETNKEVVLSNNYTVSDFIYWEENCANVIAKYSTDTNIAVETVFPFNSRSLIVKLLSIDRKYRKKQNAIHYREMIKMMWADTLSEPINPSAKKIFISILQKMKVYSAYRTVRIIIEKYLFLFLRMFNSK